jgi:hypothetical protein
MHNDPAKFVRAAACLIAASWLASCAAASSNSGAPLVPQTGAAVTPFAPACPAPGSVQRQGRASAKVILRNARPGTTLRIEWTIVFSGVDSSFQEPAYRSSLVACGDGRQARGKLGGGGGFSHHKQCQNGSCTIKDSYSVNYIPPPNFVRRIPWKFDVLTFEPVKPSGAYRLMKAALIRINR